MSATHTTTRLETSPASHPVPRIRHRIARDRRLLLTLFAIGILALIAGWAGARKGEEFFLRYISAEMTIRWAEFLRENLTGLDRILTSHLIEEPDRRVLELTGPVSGVLRFVIFDPDGTIVLSTGAGGVDWPGSLALMRAMRESRSAQVQLLDRMSIDGKATVIAKGFMPVFKGVNIAGGIGVYVDMTGEAARVRAMANMGLFGFVVLLVFAGILCGGFVRRNMLQRDADLLSAVRAHRRAMNAERRAQTLGRQRALILDAAGQGIAGIDPRGRVTFINQAGAAMLGRTVDEMIGIEFHALARSRPTSGEGQGAEVHQLHEAPEASGGEHFPDDEFVRLDGGKIPVSCTRTPIRDDMNEVVGTVIVFSDMSERRKAEDDLRRAKEEAEMANRSKSEFLANVSHELRTPLNAIIGFSEVLSAQMYGPLGSSRYKEYVGDIHDSGHHLLNIINDILDVAKAEARKLEPREQYVDLTRVIASGIRLLIERARQNEVRLEVDIASDLPLVWADERMMKQIIINLLSNAVKFTPPGGRVTVQARLEANGDVALSVIDTGIGIAEADIATALAPFGQVESALARIHDGTGLGLPLVKCLCEVHGGTMDLESQVNEWTMVTIRLPAQRTRLPVARQDAPVA